MRWIEVESADNITSRESGQTSIGCLITKEFGNPSQKECRMTAVENAIASKLADAPSHEIVTWHAIDWRKALRNVRRLQARIVKAVQAGKWYKVRALQRLLTHSFDSRVLAVKRVTENRGKQTPGVDGEVWNTPQQKAQGVKHLKQRQFKAKPLKRRYIPKSDGKKMRPLGIPCMIDRAYQALHLLALDPVAETTGDPNSYGFRRERSTADAIGQLFLNLSRSSAPQWILEGDIKACFDELSHEWLEKHVPTNKRSLRAWLKAGYMENEVFHPTEAGSPQGGIISPVVANQALDGLEPLLKQSFPSKSGKLIHLIRYADDFVITGATKTVLQNEVMPLIQAFLQERGLTLSPGKTTITHINDGFDFLGQNIRKYRSKLLIKPSRKSQRTLLQKVRTIIKTEGQYLSAYGLLMKLNPVIRGWANYHRHVVSKQVFSAIDRQIHWTLWRWAKRKHPQKSASWIRQKYFDEKVSQRNCFHTQAVSENGEKVVIRLVAAASLPIRRHVKVRTTANPYDPAWEMYFEQRQYNRVLTDLEDCPRLRHQWRRQQGICPVCGERITKETGWHNHHIHWRVYGGSDDLDNRVLLHPNCHRQVHSPDYNGPLLRPSLGVRDA
jgi:RNA-directed DNA polymerase